MLNEVVVMCVTVSRACKKNLNAPRPSEHSPVREKNVKSLGGIIGCKYKTSSEHLNRFPDGSNIASTVRIMSGRSPPLYCTLTLIAVQGHQTKSKIKTEMV